MTALTLTKSAPTLSDHPVEVGQRTEAIILAELVRRGYRLLVPFGINQRYDLVVDIDGEFVRAQCKTGRLRRGVILFNTQSVQSNMNRTLARDYTGEADLFLVYCADTERIYAVPVDGVASGYMRLGVTPPSTIRPEASTGPVITSCPDSSIGRAPLL